MNIKKATAMAEVLCPWLRCYQSDLIPILKSLPEETTLEQAKDDSRVDEIMDAYGEAIT